MGLSGDGRLALSGSEDKTAKLWETSSGRCLHTFKGHTDRVSAVSLCSDGCLALLGRDDGIVQLWFLDWEIAEQHGPGPAHIKLIVGSGLP